MLKCNDIRRCQHIKVNGTQCGSPALRSASFCYFHERWRDQHISLNGTPHRESASIHLPVLEDANSIQIALMQVMQLMISGQIDHRTASLMLYGLQTASLNLRVADFEPAHKQRVVIDPHQVDKSQLGKNLWCNQEFVAQYEAGDPETEDSMARHFQLLADAVSRSHDAEEQ